MKISFFDNNNRPQIENFNQTNEVQQINQSKSDNKKFFNSSSIKQRVERFIYDDFIRVSEISKSDFCPMAVVIRVLKNIPIEMTIDNKTAIRFLFGTIMHDMVRMLFRDKIYNFGYVCRDCGFVSKYSNFGLIPDICPSCGDGNLYPIEIEVQKGHLRGHCDGFIKDGDKFRLFELKSIDSRLFYGLNSPYQSHIAQMNLYMYLTNLDSGVILYVNREKMIDWEHKEFEVFRDDELIKKYIDMVEAIYSDISNKKVDLTMRWKICQEIRNQKCGVRSICREYF